MGRVKIRVRVCGRKKGGEGKGQEERERGGREGGAGREIEMDGQSDRDGR